MKNILLTLMVFGSLGAFAETETYDEDWKYLHCPLNESELYERKDERQTNEIFIKMDMNSFNRDCCFYDGKTEARVINTYWDWVLDKLNIELIHYQDAGVTQYDDRFFFRILLEKKYIMHDDRVHTRYDSCQDSIIGDDGIHSIGICHGLWGVSVSRISLELEQGLDTLTTCKFVTENEYEEPFLKWKEIKINEAKSRVEENKKQLEEKINNRQF